MFVFECYTHGKHSLAMFLGQYSPSSKKRIIERIQKSYTESLTPELIFLIYPKYLEEEITTLLSDPGIIVDLYRHKHSHVYRVSFDQYSKLKAKRVYKGSGSYRKLAPDDLFEDLSNSGLQSLMSKRAKDVIVKSPSGTVFVKPSGKTLEEFIYTSQLARCNFEHQFIAMCLLRHAPDLENVDSIYIDTSSISAIAEAVIYYIKQFSGANCKHITYTSFSSYSGLEENVCPDNVGGTWAIISASASTSMGRTLVQLWRIDPRQVVTILSYKPCLKNGEKNKGNGVVFCIDKYSLREEKNSSPTKVQVQGESFSVEASVPDKVVLKKKFKPSYLDEAVYKYRNGKVFSAFRNGCSLYVDYVEMRKAYLNGHEELKEDGKLSKWINKTVEWAIPRNLSAIICDNTPECDALVDDFRMALSRCDFDVKNIRIIDTYNQRDMERIGKDAVLILSPAVSTAHVFVDINRSLRLANHTGMRTFATPFVTAPSEDQFKSVNASLAEGANGFKYNYIKYKTIFLNSKSLSPWEKELEVIKRLLNGQDNDAERFWVLRKNRLEKASRGLEDFIGIHSTDPDGILEIAKDFVFWPEGYNPDEVNYSAVFATMGAIFQNLRDNSIDGNQLTANIYKHAVLDPENFVRFNDPILQSCLWRCALPGELDYRRSELLSSEIGRIFTKIFNASDSERGVTSIDLLMGLATRWIKVSSEEMKQILDAAEAHLKYPHAALLVDFMKEDFDLASH